MTLLFGLLLVSASAFAQNGRNAKAKNRYPGGSASDKLCDDQSGQRGEYCKIIVNSLMNDPDVVKNLEIVRSSSIKGMDEFCPNFDQKKNDKSWAIEYFKNLVATIITTESGWDPANKYTEKDGTISAGMCQLTAKSDNSKGGKCGQLTDGNVTDAKANIECCVQMVMKYMAEDKDVGSGKGDKGSRGIARSFGPFRDGRKERKDMAGRTAAWCNGGGSGGGGRAVASEGGIH
jgi:hypothetical protein